ncbi:MAG: FAD-dependent oxidoreductase [Pseudomonadota bacterium]|nr:FAD-dependent oxidoreductase [Pseudomonadota bacterium]
MRRKSRTVLVAGGGIAGLTTALALAREGFRVDLFEQADAFDTIGAGIQLSPNALSVLEGLGLNNLIRTVATAPVAICVMSATSATPVVEIPLGRHSLERYGRPYLVIHRADLQQALLSACSENPDVNQHMASRVEDVAAHANGVTALVRQGRAIEEFNGIALVAADGVRSRLRQTHFGAGPPVYSGLTAWRALIPADLVSRSDDLDNTRLWMGSNAHAVTYPVRGGRYLNVVVIQRAPAPGTGKAESASARDMRQNLRRWTPAFTDLLSHNAKWTRWPLYRAPALKHWTDGPIALAGDAAHAMLPFAAQGAAMGIEDARIIATNLRQAVDSGEGAAAAMACYERSRRTRVARAQRLADTNRLIYHLPMPFSLGRNMGMRMLGGERLLARQDWLYRWTPDA